MDNSVKNARLLPGPASGLLDKNWLFANASGQIENDIQHPLDVHGNALETRFPPDSFFLPFVF